VSGSSDGCASYVASDQCVTGESTLLASCLIASLLVSFRLILSNLVAPVVLRAEGYCADDGLCVYDRRFYSGGL
jgi:hypothetical protein